MQIGIDMTLILAQGIKILQHVTLQCVKPGLVASLTNSTTNFKKHWLLEMLRQV